MPPANRQNPQRVKSSQSLYSHAEFLREFPDDEACLQHLWRERHSPDDGEHAFCPKCEQERKFKRYATKQARQSWTCTGCGHHLHPTAGTIFHKSSTSLHLWFHAMFLVSSSRCGIAAKQLERDLGCNYKTAWRMLNRIRTVLMEQDYTGQLSGEVEVDETFIGGKIRESDRAKMRAAGIPLNRGPATKTRAIVVAAVERKGKLRATVVGRRGDARRVAGEFVLPGSMIYTDDWNGYHGLHRHYTHRRINHSQRIYVDGLTHTQTIEGFFGHFKTDVRGTHHSISTRWLPSYLNEWVWKWNHRDDDEAMFRQLVASAARAGRAKTSAVRTLSGKGSAVPEAVSSSALWSWLPRFGPGGSSWKMSRASSRRMQAPRLSQLSATWKKSGIWGDGLRATRSTSVSPRTESVSSLSRVLEPTVPIKSLLTAANCAGIIRREEANGRQVPPMLLAALKDTIRLWCNVGEASGTPKERVFAPRYVPRLESIREAIQTDRYFVARNLTWNECENLMGFPAGWTVVEAD